MPNSNSNQTAIISQHSPSFWNTHFFLNLSSYTPSFEIYWPNQTLISTISFIELVYAVFWILIYGGYITSLLSAFYRRIHSVLFNYFKQCSSSLTENFTILRSRYTRYLTYKLSAIYIDARMCASSRGVCPNIELQIILCMVRGEIISFLCNLLLYLRSPQIIARNIHIPTLSISKYYQTTAPA